MAAPAEAQLRLRDICRVKGQEENTLHGLGLVVGLKGTGDSNALPTARALATMMRLMGNPLGHGLQGEQVFRELKDAKNVALAVVSATVPASGARQGDDLNCEVSAISAKSLLGGHLMSTPLLGPRPGSERVYAFAQGSIYVEDPDTPTVGKVHGGCRLEEDFHNVFTNSGTITLVLDKNHASFQTAQYIADLINTQARYFQSNELANGYIAKAIDQLNIMVQIPSREYREDPVLFVSEILNQRITNLQSEARVVINQRAGTVIVGADVEIGPVIVTHKNMVIEAGEEAPSARFVAVDPENRGNTKLTELVNALNALKVPAEDTIEIIKGLERNGKLYGKLIVE
jgi:flagellar P-ring protein precursor FlgI